MTNRKEPLEDRGPHLHTDAPARAHQGVKWIKMREEKNGLKILQPTQKDYLQHLVFCLENGVPCLIEALRENVDPILEPVLSRQFIRKGNSSNRYIKLGDKVWPLPPQVYAGLSAMGTCFPFIMSDV